MCRKYYLDLIKHQALQKIVRDYGGTISPGDKAPIVVYIQGQYMTKLMTWGFLLKDKNIYNCRCETVMEKPLFKSVYTHRCLVPVSGFYEWNKRNQPISYELDKPFYLAGIYENGHFCIVTTAANSYVKSIHHRMPLVLTGDDVNRWLSDDFQSVFKVNDYHFHLEMV